MTDAPTYIPAQQQQPPAATTTIRQRDEQTTTRTVVTYAVPASNAAYLAGVALASLITYGLSVHTRLSCVPVIFAGMCGFVAGVNLPYLAVLGPVYYYGRYVVSA